MGGGYFQFFTKNRPQKHQKRAILHTSQANGEGSSPPPPPPPWLRYCIVEYVPIYQNLTYLVKDNLGLEKNFLLLWQYPTFMMN